jgi:ubiquinone/menaquinone biosynthesis C-methylase UbiE
MTGQSGRVCPVEKAGSLDSRIRRWFQRPRKIVGPYIEEGMTVADLGCGPGFFTLPMAVMVGESGRVIAADLQDGMLAKIADKIKDTELEPRITLHKCQETSLNLQTKVDFALAFYMVHELPDQSAFFAEAKAILKPGGRLLVVEPPFHVSKKDFAATVERARTVGLREVSRPRMLLDRAVLLARDK